MSASVTKVLQLCIQSNALDRRPGTRDGIMVSGGGFQGKTEAICEVAAVFEDEWRDLNRQITVPGTNDLHVPVAYVQTPVTAKPKSACEAILSFFGAPHAGLTLPQLCRQVRRTLIDNRVRVLILDDITRLKLHRADDQDTLDLIRSLMSTPATLVLIGVDIPGSGLVRQAQFDARSKQWVFPPESDDDAGTQHERRFSMLSLDPFRYDTPDNIAAWVDHLHGVEQQLRLFDAAPGMLTGGTMPEYLFRRTHGVVGLLSRLIRHGCTKAMEQPSEVLTESLLDQIPIRVKDLLAGRDPSELPDIPELQAEAKKPRAKRRRVNGSFDDVGPAGAKR